MVQTFYTISSFVLLKETCAFDKVISLRMDVGSEVPSLSQYQEWHQKNSQGQLTLKAEACLHIMLLLELPEPRVNISLLSQLPAKSIKYVLWCGFSARSLKRKWSRFYFIPLFVLQNSTHPGNYVCTAQAGGYRSRHIKSLCIYTGHLDNIYT